MHTGMLWFDNSQSTLIVKIQKAIEYYHKKYGRTPDLVLVNPSLLEKDEKSREVPLTNNEDDFRKIVVKSYRPVLPGHIWIGIEDKP